MFNYEIYRFKPPPPPKKGKKTKHAHPLDPLSGLKTNKQFLSFKLRNYKIRGFWLKSMVFCRKSAVFSQNLQFWWNPQFSAKKLWILAKICDFYEIRSFLEKKRGFLQKNLRFLAENCGFWQLALPTIFKIRSFQPKTADSAAKSAQKLQKDAWGLGLWLSKVFRLSNERPKTPVLPVWKRNELYISTN